MDKKFFKYAPKVEEITIEISARCPLCCLHCSTKAGPNENQKLSRLQVLKIIQESVNLGAKRINLSGGEPFAHPDIFDLLLKTRKIGGGFYLYTSGNTMGNGAKIQPIGENLIKAIAGTNHRLVFGVQGADETTHDYITTFKGSFQNLVTSAKKSNEFGVPFEFHFVPMNPNFDQLGEVVSMAERMGAEKVSILRFVPQGRGKNNKEKLDLTTSQIFQLSKNLARLKDEFSGFIRLGSPWNALGLGEPTPCASGLGKILVNAWGQAHVCEALKHLTKGYDAINGSLLEFINETRGTRFLDLLECKCNFHTGHQWRVKGCIAQTVLSRQTSDTSLDPIYDALKSMNNP